MNRAYIDFGTEDDLNSYKGFESKFNTKVQYTYDNKLKWEINGESKVISRAALGRYKRYRVNMNEVLELVSFNKTINGSLLSSKRVINYLNLKNGKVDKNGRRNEN